MYIDVFAGICESPLNYFDKFETKSFQAFQPIPLR